MGNKWEAAHITGTAWNGPDGYAGSFYGNGDTINNLKLQGGRTGYTSPSNDIFVGGLVGGKRWNEAEGTLTGYNPAPLPPNT